MTLREITLTVPVKVYYDSDHTDTDGAVTEFGSALSDADEAGLFDRQLIDFTYGDPQVSGDEPAPPGTQTMVGCVADDDSEEETQ